MIENLKRIGRVSKEILLSAKDIAQRRLFIHKKGLERLSVGNYNLYRRLCDNIIKKNDLLIVDVGANDGWFSNILYAFVPGASIRAFEPLLSQEKNLRALAKPGRDFVYSNKAVGDKKGKKVLHESKTSGLSSLREQIAGAYDYYFDPEVVAAYEVEVTTLDDEFKHEKKNLLVKIDVQGYEMEVLRGAEHLLRQGKIAFLVIELCTRAKYAGQTLDLDIIDFLARRGFKLWDIYPSYYEHDTGELSEYDAVFAFTPDTYRPRPKES